MNDYDVSYVAVIERDDDDIMHLLSRCEVVKNGKRLIFKWLKETSKRMNLK